MNKKLKWAAVSIASVAVLAGAAYGGWTAWDTGRIGNNPRAISPKAMAEAVRKQALFANLRRNPAQSCINVDLGQPRPDLLGLPGIAPRAMPGQYALSLLVQTNTREQPARYLQLEQLHFLAAQGFLKVENTQLETDDGALPAVRYELTWDGYKMFGQEGGGTSFCLYYGQRTIGEITQIERVDDKFGDFEVYEATVTSSVQDVPAWASHADAKRRFTSLVEALEERTEKVKVIRTREGWRSILELQTELQLSGNEREATSYRRQLMQLFQEPKSLSLAEARDLIVRQQNDVQWSSRNAVACLPLRLARGGDDAAARSSRDPESFAVLIQDRDDRKEHEYRALAMQLHLLSALKAVGFVEMEIIRPRPPAAPSRSRGAAAPQVPVAPAELPGVRFKVHPSAVSAFGLTNGSGCLPAGRLGVEPLAVRGEAGNSARVVARGTISEPPDWALKLSAHLPALKSMLDNGIPVRTTLTVMTPTEQPQGWRVADMSPMYPEMQYSGMPAELAAMLPKTAAAMPKAPVIKAPALVQQGDANSQAVLNATAAASTAGAATVAAKVPAAVMPPQAAVASPAGRAPPFAAGSSPVHVVSIYQGMDRPGTPQPKLGDPPPDPPLEGVMNVTVSVPNALVLLFAYEPVEWRVKVAAGGATPRIIAIGAHKQRITLTGLGRADTSTLDMDQLWQRAGEVPSIPRHNSERNNMVQIRQVSQLITGQSPASFQTQSVDYKQPRLTEFNISPQTVRFALPAATSPQGNGSPIVLRSSSREEVRDYVLYRGASGAYTNAWTDRAFSAGKGYYEATMRVTGSLNAHTHSNAGFCMAQGTYTDSDPRTRAVVMRSGQEKLHKDGDLFGIAVDFDKQRMYFRVNGRWVDGEPGSEGGVRLEKDKEYRACAYAAGTVTGDVKKGKPQSDTTWEMNFGQKPFKHPPPAGYLPLGGA